MIVLKHAAANTQKKMPKARLMKRKKTQVSKYAMVKLGDYTVPLIGISPEATQDKCDGCGKITHISELSFEGGSMLCKKCKAL